jgi:metallophosphoesterase (TIGR00282 family)
MSKILFFGDVFGKPGRAALAQALPGFREQYNPDVVIVNVENMAHGKGVTMSTMAEMSALNIDCFTSGNHVFKKGELSFECFEKYPNLIRPSNYEGTYPGHGFYRFAKNDQQYLVINLNGQVFFEKQFESEIKNPFFALDEILTQEAQKGDIIIVDFHAEATSEKQAMGWHADGRATGVFGTHTHVPTADARILKQGTAFCTDVGMCGPRDSVIGASISNVVDSFLEKAKYRLEVADSEMAIVNGIYIETDGPKAIKVEKLQKEINLGYSA